MNKAKQMDYFATFLFEFYFQRRQRFSWRCSGTARSAIRQKRH